MQTPPYFSGSTSLGRNHKFIIDSYQWTQWLNQSGKWNIPITKIDDEQDEVHSFVSYIMRIPEIVLSLMGLKCSCEETRSAKNQEKHLPQSCEEHTVLIEQAKIDDANHFSCTFDVNQAVLLFKVIWRVFTFLSIRFRLPQKWTGQSMVLGLTKLTCITTILMSCDECNMNENMFAFISWAVCV